jgi:hypothetical protein
VSCRVAYVNEHDDTIRRANLVPQRQMRAALIRNSDHPDSAQTVQTFVARLPTWWSTMNDDNGMPFQPDQVTITWDRWYDTWSFAAAVLNSRPIHDGDITGETQALTLTNRDSLPMVLLRIVEAGPFDAPHVAQREFDRGVTNHDAVRVMVLRIAEPLDAPHDRPALVRWWLDLSR